MKEFQTDYGLTPDGICRQFIEKMLLGVVAGTVAKKAQSISTQTGTWWDEIKHFQPTDPYIVCPCPRCRGKNLYPEKRLM